MRMLRFENEQREVKRYTSKDRLTLPLYSNRACYHFEKIYGHGRCLHSHTVLSFALFLLRFRDGTS